MKGQVKEWFLKSLDIGIERMCRAGMHFRPQNSGDVEALLEVWGDALWSLPTKWEAGLDVERFGRCFTWLIQHHTTFPTLMELREALAANPRHYTSQIEHKKASVAPEDAAENWRRIRVWLRDGGEHPELIRGGNHEKFVKQ